MANLKAVDRMLLERLFEMQGGFVLSFSDSTFQEFVRASTGEDIYAETYAVNGGSKARRMRAFWTLAPDGKVAALLDDLLTWMIDSKKLETASAEAARVRKVVQGLRGGAAEPPSLESTATTDARPSAFISYSNAKKVAGAAVKEILERHGYRCFLAHEDVKVSEKWKERILRELRAADVFVAVLSKEFVESAWCGQEVGFIASRPEVLIVPLSTDGTVPYGFIAHVQGKPVTRANIALVLEDVLFRERPRQMIPAQIARVRAAREFRRAEDAFRPLVPHFSLMTDAEADLLALAAAANPQVWDAMLCRDEFLPALVRAKGPTLSTDAATALKLVLPDLYLKQARPTLP